MQPTPPKFCEELQKAREAAGLTQQQAADKLGIAVGTLRNWEQDRRHPTALLQQTVLKTISTHTKP